MQVFSRRSVNVFCAILVALSSMVSLEAQAIQVTAKQLHQLVDEGIKVLSEVTAKVPGEESEFIEMTHE